MPRKTKELEEIPIKNTKKSITKLDKATTKSTNTVKKTSTKKTTEKKSTTTKTTKAVSKTATQSTKKVTTKNVEKVSKLKNSTPSGITLNTKTIKVTNESAKGTKKNKVSKKNTSKTNMTNTVSVLEYYDLPLRYNQTIVKILAQTPNMLFVYWDIADIDRKSFEEHYGNNFFKETKPVLIVHNETINYSFEIEINDFANSWYLHVNDADCKYSIELIRRPLPHISTIKEEYIYVSSSNKINSPNNHILFEKFNPHVTYKNLKNGDTVKRDFNPLSKYKNMQEIYNIYDLYKTIYKDELFGEISSKDLYNPSSMSSSSFI